MFIRYIIESILLCDAYRDIFRNISVGARPDTSLIDVAQNL